MNDKVTSGPGRRFCVLEYHASESDRDQGDSPKIIALVIFSPDGQVAIRVHPEWEKIVLPTDREYLEALYGDFHVRIKSDPDALFQQLSELSVGPLVTREAGSDLAAYPAYLRMAEWFQEV